jgi:cytochrome c oxidase assembly factor CtaG
LALRSDLVHDIEHLSFYVSSLLLWWHIIQSGPRVHRPLSGAARIAYTLSVVPANMVAGVVISFAQSPIYLHYTTVPRVWNLSALQDQQIGGAIMWIPGSMMYLLAGIILISRQVQGERTEVQVAG